LVVKKTRRGDNERMKITQVTEAQSELITRLRKLNQALADFGHVPSVKKSLKAEIKAVEKQLKSKKS
jgi:hypothetical protein